jgi:signal peptidase II
MRLKNSPFWVVAVIAILVDQLTKHWVIQNFPYEGYSIPLIAGVFEFTYKKNTGVAFGWFTGKAELWRWISLVVSLVLIKWGYSHPDWNRWEKFGYGLILGGAIGNGIDRFRLGYVVDFLHFSLINFPIFNVADSCISAGVACLLVSIFRKT